MKFYDNRYMGYDIYVKLLESRSQLAIFRIVEKMDSISTLRRFNSLLLLQNVSTDSTL